LELKYKTDKETGELIPIRGEYRISPEMFWKGELKKRTELKVTIETKYSDDLQTDEF
jgi:hypothetical protein